MSVINHNVESIEVRKIKPAVGKINIENRPVIDNIKHTKIVSKVDDKEIKNDGLLIFWTFETKYSKEDEEIANITIKGTLLYKTKDEEDAKSIIDKWEKEKKLPEQEHISLINYLLNKGTLLALDLSQKVGLPPVINMPRIVKRD